MFDALRQFRADDVFNPWSGTDVLDCRSRGGARRLLRLRQHFDCEPLLLLVGEAAGYQGCHYSGIPFTSERLLLEGVIPRVPCDERLTRRARPWSEPSAAIVWKALQALGIAERVVLWNTFPWHPHRRGEPHSNRRPSRAELRWGEPVLRAVLARFEHALPVAVGQVAWAGLTALAGTQVPLLRHPAYGGARAFTAGLTQIVRGLRRRAGRKTGTGEA